PVQGGFLRQCLALRLQSGQALAQAGNPRLKLGLVNEALRITVDQPGHALASLADLVFDGCQRRAGGARRGLAAAAGFFRKPLRVGQQGTDFLPHRQVQQVSPHLRIVADTLAPKAVGVCPQTAVIGVGARLAFAGTRAQAFAIEGIATVLALEQALQQIQGPPARLAGMALVLLELSLYCGEHLRFYKGWHGDRDPVFRGDIARRHGTARLHRSMALGPQPGPQRLQARLAKRCCPLIGRVFQDAPHDTAIPDRLAGAGYLAGESEAATDLANRQAVAADPCKDLADDTSFVREDLIARLAIPL